MPPETPLVHQRDSTEQEVEHRIIALPTNKSPTKHRARTILAVTFDEQLNIISLRERPGEGEGPGGDDKDERILTFWLRGEVCRQRDPNVWMASVRTEKNPG